MSEPLSYSEKQQRLQNILSAGNCLGMKKKVQ